MPFTASHVAAVLPLARTPLVPSALVVGSMVPDLPLYLPFLGYPHTHSVPGVFGSNAAAGLAVLMVWHLLLVEPLYATAPRALRRRVPRPVPISRLLTPGWPGRLVLTYASLVIGAATHVTWDAFTHAGSWGSRHIGWLAARHGPLHGYSWAQYASTLFGAALVAAWLAHRWKGTPLRESVGAADPADPRHPVASALGQVAWLVPPVMGGAVAVTVAGSLLVGHGSDVRRAAYFAVTFGVSTALTATALLAIGWRCTRGLRADSD